MTKIQELHRFGQSVWIDYIRRAFITSGELSNFIDQGVRGITSNPSIFERAIAGSSDYDASIRNMVDSEKSIEEIYEALALQDILKAADLMRPIYSQSDGADGYVSLEVNPKLGHDTDGTIREARRLFAELDRPNVMIKVPATPEGVLAVETLISEGINVNVTLIFSLAQYETVAQAYLRGLEKLAESGGDLRKVASVASFFISRVDTATDRILDGMENAGSLKGKIAISNAKVAYARFKDLFSGDRWDQLAKLGAREQRPLWASTSTKNPLYPDTLYVDELIGEFTINTIPPDTLRAFMDHGHPASTIGNELHRAKQYLQELEGLGIDLELIAQELLDDGVNAFSNAFDIPMVSISEKRDKLLTEQKVFTTSLGTYQADIDRSLHEIKRDRIMARIHAHDHTIWKSDPAEITNRLGWLTIPDKMLTEIQNLHGFAQSLTTAGFTHALLLGMGGSSLAPQVFRDTFGVSEGYLDLTVLDSTDPGAVHAKAQALDPGTTLYIVATKSGGTVETLSLFKYFYNQVSASVGEAKAGDHFVAITDPGSSLIEIAERYRFRKIYLNDANIGGRYSALSYFGLVPASLLGIDLEQLLQRALRMSCNCDSCNSPVDGDNLGALLGVILGELAKMGRNKLTFITSPSISSFSDWAEQLIAESTGKDGKGILPVVGETVREPGFYGPDRLFVYLELVGDQGVSNDADKVNNSAVQLLEEAGHPVVRIRLEDEYDLGAQFYLWQVATAIAGYRLNIHPFDQPNVESAKILARKMVSAYQEEGRLPSLPAGLKEDNITVYADIKADGLSSMLIKFLTKAEERAYIALQAYVNPDGQIERALQEFRERLQEKTKLATTLGYGPRFLHSTGQLHKGDDGAGLFIQITADMPHDIDIPDKAGEQTSSISFGILKSAQALGDRQALIDNDRKVIRFHINGDVVAGIKRLTSGVSYLERRQ